MSNRPHRIDQIIPSIIERDAVSNHTFEAQKQLREMGFASEIFASTIGPGCAGRVRPLSELSSVTSNDDWLLYQCSIGSPVADVFAKHRGTKLLDYHNITPAFLVERWIPPLADEARLGRTQLLTLAPLCAASFADSVFNAKELENAGFKDPGVVSVLVDGANYDAAPDSAKFAALTAAKNNGGADWLFVGQIAAHKAQHDVVAAFYCYRKLFDGNARLHIVGREMGSAYKAALQRFVYSLHLDDVVDLPGAVPTGDLAAYYETADVFVCCSDHEGFCAPVIEAMHHGVPVVAHRAAAVTETVGDAGVLLADKRPAVIACAVDQILSTPNWKKSLIDRGKEQAARYTLSAAQTAFRAAIDKALANT